MRFTDLYKLHMFSSYRRNCDGDVMLRTRDSQPIGVGTHLSNSCSPDCISLTRTLILEVGAHLSSALGVETVLLTSDAQATRNTTILRCAWLVHMHSQIVAGLYCTLAHIP